MSGDGISRTGNDVVRDVFQGLAPELLDLFPELQDAYMADPREPGDSGARGGRLLGIGLDLLHPAMVPLLFAVTAQVLADLSSGAVRRGLESVATRKRRGRQRARRAARVEALRGPAPSLDAEVSALLLDWVSRVIGGALPPPERDRVALVVAAAVLGVPALPGSEDRRTPRDPGTNQSPPLPHSGKQD